MQFLQNSVFVLVNISLFGTKLGEASKGHLEQDEHHKRRLGVMYWLSRLEFTLQQLCCTAQELPGTKGGCPGEICFCHSSHKEDTVFHDYSLHCI